MKDYYAILEVAPSASVEVIDASWKALLRQCHPDLAGSSARKRAEFEERSRELNEAHECLSDPKKRKNYDASLQFERAQTTRVSHRGVNSEAYPQPYPGVPHIRFDPQDILHEFVVGADLSGAIEKAFGQACQAVMAKVVRENPIIGEILEHARKQKRKKSA